MRELAWVNWIEESQAKGELKEHYEYLKRSRGKVSNIMKVQSLNPDAMMAHLTLYMKIMFGKSELTRIQREMIATLVSTTNNCRYCVLHHGEALMKIAKNEKLVDQLLLDYKKAEISKKDKAMLNYAVNLTKNPANVTKEDIEMLRKVGFSDNAILSINLVACYFNFVNRIALGLGVPYSEAEIKGYKL